MKIEFREAKSVITKSNIPGIDYVINPYTGCQHGCIYCYAEFMKRFTNHKGDIWGDFLDIKSYPWEKINPFQRSYSTKLRLWHFLLYETIIQYYATCSSNSNEPISSVG